LVRPHRRRPSPPPRPRRSPLPPPPLHSAALVRPVVVRLFHLLHRATGKQSLTQLTSSLFFFFFFSGGESAFSPAASVFGAPQAAAPTSTFGASAPFRCVPSPPLCFPTLPHPCLFVFVFFVGGTAARSERAPEPRARSAAPERLATLAAAWPRAAPSRPHLSARSRRHPRASGRRIRGSALCCRCLPVPHLRRRSLGVLWRRARPGRWRRLLSWRRARRCPRRPSRLARSSPRQGRRTLNLSGPHPPNHSGKAHPSTLPYLYLYFFILLTWGLFWAPVTEQHRCRCPASGGAMERVRKAPNSTQHPNFDIIIGPRSKRPSVDRPHRARAPPLLAPTRPPPPIIYPPPSVRSIVSPSTTAAALKL
jgi:hypothetical protein